MPFSQTSQLSAIVGYIERAKPRSLLDVGVGMGQYGFLARINLEYLNLFEVDGAKGWQRPKEQWEVRIDGIEACDVYMTPVQEYAYNEIFLGDAREVLPTLGDDGYEMVIAVDILEHFEKADGLRFLEELKRIASGPVLVSTPKEFHAQEVEANPYENHRSHWTEEELKGAGFTRILDNEESWIAVHEPSFDG